MSITIDDPIVPIADAAIEHMNQHHAESVLAYARALAGLAWAEAATMQGIDANGFDLRVVGAGQEQTIRIPFTPPLIESAQLRPALVALAQQASAAAEPPVTTSPPPIQNAQSAEQLANAISTRRSFSLKEIAPDPIDLGLVARLLEAANWAPSHGKTEPWRFVVYSGDARQMISDAFGEAFRFLSQGAAYNEAGERAQRERAWQAPVWIALGVQPDPKMPHWEELIAFGSAVQNAQLMAGALGLASKWTSGAVAIHPHVAEVVGFAPHTQLLGFLYVGRPAIPWPEGRRRPLHAKVRWVSAANEVGHA